LLLLAYKGNGGNDDNGGNNLNLVILARTPKLRQTYLKQKETGI
jgi:hypothetical protein